MADTVEITPGSGAVIGTDEVTIGAVAQQVQRMKLVDGTDGGTDLIPGTAARGLSVDPRPNRRRTTQAISGLTTATTLYSSGDQLGAIVELTSMARSSGGGGWLSTFGLVVDTPAVVSGVRAWFFSGSVTLASDNAAFSISDADMAKYQGHVFVPAPNGYTNGAAQIITNVNLDYVCDATSLFVALETVSTHTAHFGASDDINVVANAFLL